jgi:FkbM family methyltransferase
MIHTIGRYIIQLPQDHALPKIQINNPLYDKGYIPALSMILNNNPSGTVVDIGANVGDSAALFATCGDNPILCVEGSASFLPFLHKNIRLFENQVNVIEKFVKVSGNPQESYTLVESKGTASLVQTDGNSMAASMSESMISVKELDTEAGDNIALFKTDTDGFDIGIVNDFICLDKEINPVIFMEYDLSFGINPKNQARELFNVARTKGYLIAAFTNRGLPLFFDKEINTDLLLDVGNFCIFQRAFGIKLEYLDLFLFPKDKKGLWSEISRAYRSRRVL